MSIVRSRLKDVVTDLRGEAAFAYIARAREVARRKGLKVISFGIGQPDIPTFDPIIEEGKRALDERFTAYTETPGIPELREAIALYLRTRYGADVSQQEVVVTPGTKTAIFMALAAVVDRDDEVIIHDPTYPAYPEVTKLFRGRPVFVPLKFEPEKGFDLDPKAIENAITERTKVIVINNPHNPTGAVFDEQSLRKVLEIAKDHRIVVVVDEIYDNFVYPPRKFVSILQLDPEWKKYVIYINGFSKTFSMTGWRLGYLVADREIIDYMKKLGVNMYSCPPSISQKAGIRALRDDVVWDYVKRMIEVFRERRDVMYEELKKVPGFEVYKGDGAFYLFPRIEKTLEMLSMDVESFVNWLIEEHGVVILPGTAFSYSEIGKKHVRFSYAVSTSSIREGVERIRRAIETKLSAQRS